MRRKSIAAVCRTTAGKTVDIIQIAAGLALADQRSESLKLTSNGSSIGTVTIHAGVQKIPTKPQDAGLVNGFAIYGPNIGSSLKLKQRPFRTKRHWKAHRHRRDEEEEMEDPASPWPAEHGGGAAVDNVL